MKLKQAPETERNVLLICNWKPPKACGENSLNAICPSLLQLQSSYHWCNQSCELLMKDNNWTKTLHFTLVLPRLWTVHSVWLTTMLCHKQNRFLAFVCFPWTQETDQFPHTWGGHALCVCVETFTKKTVVAGTTNHSTPMWQCCFASAPT
jgi:hypothetical protein